jgi:hypothetical protein
MTSSVCNGDEIVSILDVSNQSILDISSSDSDYEISDADVSESESGTCDSGNITGATEVSDWLQVTDSDPGPSTAIPVQNIECKAVVPLSFDCVPCLCTVTGRGSNRATLPSKSGTNKSGKRFNQQQRKCIFLRNKKQ